jgi:hypothetical protein
MYVTGGDRMDDVKIRYSINGNSLNTEDPNTNAKIVNKLVLWESQLRRLAASHLLLKEIGKESASNVEVNINFSL